MKTKKIILALAFLFCMFLCVNNANAETLPNVSKIVDQNIGIEPYNFDGNYYPDLSGQNMTVTIYAYLNPAFGRGSKDNPSLPAPFNKHYTWDVTDTKTFYAGAVGGSGNYTAYLYYCVGYGVHLNGNTVMNNVSRVYDWAGNDLSAKTRNLISLALIYGFDSDPSTGSSVADACIGIRNTQDGRHVWANASKVFATQVAVWLASTDNIGTPQQDAIARYLFEIDGVVNQEAYDIYSGIASNIERAQKMPSYTSVDANSAPVYELKWNATNKRFEYTFTDTNNMNDVPKVAIDWQLDGTGLNKEVNGNTVTLWTNDIVGTIQSPVTIGLRKDINGGKGVAGFWQKGGPTDFVQPLTRLMGIDRTPEYSYIKVYTSGIRVSIKKTLTSTTGNFGDASPEGATYGIYRDSNCNDLVTTVTIGKNGWSNKTEYIPYQTYYVKETLESPSTVKDPNVYTIDPSTATTDADGDFSTSISVTDDVKESKLQITKKLAETDYDAEIPLEGCQFKVYLQNDSNQVYYTNISGKDGICTLENIPYGRYVVSEYITPDCAYTINDQTFDFVKDNYTYEVTFTDPSKLMKIEVEKVLLDKVVGKTDAKVSGAYFTVYTDAQATQPYTDKNGNTVIIGPTDASGYAISKEMRTGTYYLKETRFPEGINPDAMVPGENITFRDKIYTASYDNKIQGTDVVNVPVNGIVNIPNMGRVRVMKYKDNPDSTEKSSAEGAILRLTLDSSNGTVYYDATIDEYGYAEFVNEELIEYYPYTIPYGTYTITEIQEPLNGGHSYFFIQPEKVVITNEEENENRILSDNPTPTLIKIVKKDKTTGNIVALPGAKFKIWSVDKKDWVSLMTYPSGEYITEFETNEKGYLYTPQKLQPGKYVIYETQAPEGYYLQDNLRLPKNNADLGDVTVSGQEVVINKLTNGLGDDATYPEGGEVTGEPTIEVEMKDTPLTVNLEIHKTGEKLTGSKSSTVEYKISETETQKEDKYIGTYTQVGLEGVGYRIYAVADTFTPDGIQRYDKDQMVADITTNSEGIAIATKLYPGEYRIEEYKTPVGYLVDENIPNVVLENKDQYIETATLNKELSDVRQKLSLTFKKVFDEVNYANGETVKQEATFGIYTKEAIKNYKGDKTVIPSNKLVALAEVDENGDVTSPVDLPEGKYYVKELYASYPYTISNKITEFTLEYNNNDKQEFIVVEGEEFTNNYDSASITLVKLATTTVNDIIVNGDEIDTSTLDEEVKEIIDAIKGMTEEEIKEYFAKNEVKFVAGAKYRIYTDEECTNALRIKNEETGVFEIAELVTNDTGLIKLENVPVGEYYVKEIEAPKGYELSKEVVKVVLDNTNKNTMIYQALIESDVIESFITKTDIFTGDVVPNCTFEIKDMDGKVLLHSITNEDGKAFIPLSILENEKTYTYTEIEAPDIYDLNTEPHEFTVKFDEEGNWITEPIEVENIRKTREVIVRKVDAETGDPLEGCVFTIALIDPTTGEQIINAKTGKPVYLVENATTNEDGEFVIEKAPMGTYRFTEIKAPEGYELDEDLTGLEFTIDNNSPETIIFEVTNTGDIAVITLSVIAIASIFGIAYIVLKNKKAKLQ